jgi:hypothetical protein
MNLFIPAFAREARSGYAPSIISNADSTPLAGHSNPFSRCYN